MRARVRASGIALLPFALVLSGGTSHAARCGKEGGAPCKVWDRVPSCDQNLVERAGRCVHPPCGRLGQRPCTVDVRVPSCDVGLIEWGRCVKKGDCGAAFQRPCTLADRLPPSCNDGLREDFGRKECVPMRPGHLAFFDGLKSLTDEVAKGSQACEGFLVASTSVQKVEWFGAVAGQSRAAAAGGAVVDAGMDCSRHLAIGFICAAPSQAKKVGAPVELYNNIADAYEGETCAAEARAPAWRHRPARLLGPSNGLECPYSAPPSFDPPLFDPAPDPTGKGGAIGSCWACPRFTYRTTSPVQAADACARGDARDPQSRAMCAAFTTFVDRGVKPLQCLERLIGSVVSTGGSREDRNRVCAVAGALAFDVAVDVALGRVDPESKLKKLAQAVARTRTALKGPALLVKMNEEARKIDACRGVFVK